MNHPQSSGDPGFQAVLSELWSLHCRKSTDYGDDQDVFANINSSADFGIPPWLGSILRANDKMYRLKTFAKKGNLANESVEDSMLDLASQAIIGLVLYRKEAAKQHAREPEQVPAEPGPVILNMSAYAQAAGMIPSPAGS